MAGSSRCAFRVILCSAACLVATPAMAQWHAELQAGRLQYDAAPEAVTTSLAAGLSFSAPTSALSGAIGVPFSSGEPVWLALQGLKRIAVGDAVTFGLDLGADAFGYHLTAPDTSVLPVIGGEGEAITGWGGAAEAMPFLARNGARVDLEARAGVITFFSGGNRGEGLRRTAFVADAHAQTAWRALSVRAEGRWVQAPERGFPFAGATLVWNGPVTLWGAFGRWFDEVVESPTWRAGASIPLGSRVALQLNGEHEEIDPVYGTPARTTWGAGLRVLLGDAARVRHPVPDAYVDGVATISVDYDGEGVPSIAGDFNAWTPEPMRRDPASDSWLFRTPLRPGVYHYAFVDTAGNWFVPEGTPGRRSDGMGGHVAVLVVEEE